MTERATAIPPRIRGQIGAYTRTALNRGPYETNGGHADMATLDRMGLIVTGSYPDVKEIKRYDAGNDAWESVPVYSRTVRIGRGVVTVFEPVTEDPEGSAR